MRFFIDNELTLNANLVLSDDVYHHWVKVLRANVGDSAVLFNGKGGEYTATLTDINKKSATVHIDSHDPTNRTPPYAVTLVQAISKGERMDYTIQKACELGVSAIQLITTERSDRLRYERDNKKLTHWQKVAISACEQCGLNIIPQILPPVALHDYLASCHGLDDTLKIIMSLPIHDDNGTPHKAFTPHAIALPPTISLIVGAEGGLSDDEIKLCHEHGFLVWAIGERVLRTETAGAAGLAGLAVIHQMNSVK